MKSFNLALMMMASAAVALTDGVARADVMDGRAEALGKVLASDALLRDRPIVRVAVIADEADKKRALTFQGALSVQGFGSLLVPLSEPGRAAGHDVFFFLGSAFSDELADRALKDHVLTVVSSSELVEQGKAAVYLGLKDGQPDLAIHFGRLEAEGHKLEEEGVKDARVFAKPEPKAPPPSDPTEAEKPKNAAPYVLEQALISRVEPKFPSTVLAAYKGKNVESVVLVCVGKDGSVDPDKTRLLKTLPGTEAALLEAVRQWRYKPQPITICAPVRFVINVD
ncbi:MAG: hypothetical protein HYV07_29060 [Deltaproteobacteria bacterium]|nr:hypothetical protein [Deltaproteobacteria bacterium]